MKNPLTPAGIEPATFRFVAQRLNHCTVVPLMLFDTSKNNWYQFQQYVKQWLVVTMLSSQRPLLRVKLTAPTTTPTPLAVECFKLNISPLYVPFCEWIRCEGKRHKLMIFPGTFFPARVIWFKYHSSADESISFNVAAVRINVVLGNSFKVWHLRCF